MVAKRLEVVARPVELDTVVQASLAALRGHAMQKGVQLELSVTPGSYRTVGDAARLEQVISNLLANAIKFSNADGHVNVELIRRDDHFELRVKDVGIGITAEFLPHVFERFRQGDRGRTRQYGGLGIGLTLARHLVELHGGTIEAFSAGEGRGATFVVRLPCRDADAGVSAAGVSAAGAEPATPPVERSASALRGLRILVVDDDEDARDLMAMVLGEAGAIVRVEGSASAAVGAFEGERFDVVISDLGMPGEDGFSLIRRIRALEIGRERRVIAVAVSGYGSSEDRGQSRRSGFEAHLTKPCEPSMLIALLSRLKPATS
jgi:CheY-like chemotaxis protein